MNQEDAYSLARAILLIGGILAVALGATLLGSYISGARALADLTSVPGPLLTIVVGVIALVASSRVKDESIDIVLAVLGFIAGGIGGILVAIAGIWAIISKHTIKSA